MEKIRNLYGRALRAADATTRAERADALRVFASNLHKTFYGFEPDFFQHNLLRVVDDVVSVIKGSIELWPTLVETCYFQKVARDYPSAVATLLGRLLGDINGLLRAAGYARSDPEASEHFVPHLS